jgi:hypothetical protein
LGQIFLIFLSLKGDKAKREQQYDRTLEMFDFAIEGKNLHILLSIGGFFFSHNHFS